MLPSLHGGDSSLGAVRSLHCGLWLSLASASCGCHCLVSAPGLLLLPNTLESVQRKQQEGRGEGRGKKRERRKSGRGSERGKVDEGGRGREGEGGGKGGEEKEEVEGKEKEEGGGKGGGEGEGTLETSLGWWELLHWRFLIPGTHQRHLLQKKLFCGVPVVAQWLTNPTRNQEVSGLIPALGQWG